MFISTVLEQEQADRGTKKSHDNYERGSKINKDIIKMAIKKQVPYFRSNMDYVPFLRLISLSKVTAHVG